MKILITFGDKCTQNGTKNDPDFSEATPGITLERERERERKREREAGMEGERARESGRQDERSGRERPLAPQPAVSVAHKFERVRQPRSLLGVGMG